MTKKKGKKKRTDQPLPPEIASAVERLLQGLKDHEDRGEPLEIS